MRASAWIAVMLTVVSNVSTTWAHPGHAVEPAAADFTHRVSSPYHWLESIVVLAAAGLAGWLLSRRSATSAQAVDSRPVSLR